MLLLAEKDAAVSFPAGALSLTASHLTMAVEGWLQCLPIVTWLLGDEPLLQSRTAMTSTMV